MAENTEKQGLDKITIKPPCMEDDSNTKYVTQRTHQESQQNWTDWSEKTVNRISQEISKLNDCFKDELHDHDTRLTRVESDQKSQEQLNAMIQNQVQHNTKLIEQHRKERMATIEDFKKATNDKYSQIESQIEKNHIENSNKMDKIWDAVQTGDNTNTRYIFMVVGIFVGAVITIMSIIFTIIKLF